MSFEDDILVLLEKDVVSFTGDGMVTCELCEALQKLDLEIDFISELNEALDGEELVEPRRRVQEILSTLEASKPFPSVVALVTAVYIRLLSLLGLIDLAIADWKKLDAFSNKLASHLEEQE